MTVSELLAYVRRRTGDAVFDKDTAVFRDVLRRAVRRCATAFGWSFFRVVENINLVDPKTDGTVSLTHGSATVTGSGTNFVSGDVGKIFRPYNSNTTYIISAVASTTSMTLTGQYIDPSEEDLTGQEYEILTADYALANDVSKMLEVVNTQIGRNLVWVPRSTMDQWMRGLCVASVPQYFTSINDGSDSFKVRLWPPPDKQYPIITIYQRNPADPSTTDDTATIDWPARTEVLESAAFYEACGNGGTASAKANLGLARSEYMATLENAKAEDRAADGPVVIGGQRKQLVHGQISVTNYITIP